MPRLNKLDDVLFPVEEHPVFVSVSNGEPEKRLLVPDKKAIVNTKSERVLGIVSRGYLLVTNQQALDWAFQCCRTVFPETQVGEWEVKATDAPSTGGHCFIDILHNSTALDFSIVAPNERPDAFGPFIRVTNSYNRRRALAFDIGFYRKVCKNGMIFRDAIIRFTFTHLRRELGEEIQFEVSNQKLADAKASFRQYLDTLRNCKVIRVDFEPMLRVALLLSVPTDLKPDTREAEQSTELEAHLSELSDRYAREVGENAYAVFNAITEFASHPPANRYVNRERHSFQKLAGSWLTDFSAQCRRSGFTIAKYLEESVNSETQRVSYQENPPGA
jgi:Domain of unknown function (DUF932).